MNEHREMLRNALDAIEKLQLRLKKVESQATQPIAVVGCGLRYPGGVETLEGLRDILENRNGCRCSAWPGRSAFTW